MQLFKVLFLQFLSAVENKGNGMRLRVAFRMWDRQKERSYNHLAITLLCASLHLIPKHSSLNYSFPASKKFLKALILPEIKHAQFQLGSQHLKKKKKEENKYVSVMK